MNTFADRVRNARSASQCSRCYREATVRVVGKWGNGHAAVDLRCAGCAPHPSDVGMWAWMGASDREFLIERMEPVEDPFEDRRNG